MPVTIALTVFGLVLVAELPDKTMIATLIMGSRFRPVFVWLGAVAAFAMHVTLAVAVGRLLQLLPHRWVEGITAVLFAAGAVYLLVVPEQKWRRWARRRPRERGRPRGLKTVATAFTIIFLGEFGDLTQILTANLAAKYHDPVAVFMRGARRAGGGRCRRRLRRSGPAAGCTAAGHPQGRRRRAGCLRRLLTRRRRPRLSAVTALPARCSGRCRRATGSPARGRERYRGAFDFERWASCGLPASQSACWRTKERIGRGT